MSCEEAFFKQLRDQGFRLTPQREMVLSVMHEIEGHATAEEIYERVHALSSSVDISTVYRTLELLGKFGLVAGVELEDGQRRYELIGVHGPHAHLVCRSCGKLIGVEETEMQFLIERMREKHGFHADVEHLSIPGMCLECLAAKAA